MSYSANQYNYATPLSSSTGLFGDTSVVADKKYFTLFENTLNGNYSVISGDVGLWGKDLSNADGTLPEPFVVTFNETVTAHSLSITGSVDCYPVDFTIKVYNGSTLLNTFEVTGNTDVTYIAKLPRVTQLTSFTVTITKISKANNVVRLYNASKPYYLKRVDALLSSFTEVSAAEPLGPRTYQRSDSLKIKNIEQSRIRNVFSSSDVLRTKASDAHPGKLTNIVGSAKDTLNVSTPEDISKVRNIIDVTKDTLIVSHEEEQRPKNIHTVMKDIFRQVYGKVYITYTDPMLDDETTVTSNSEAYNSIKEQVLDGFEEAFKSYFTLHDNDLTGKYLLTSQYDQVGWYSAELSKTDGTFASDPSLTVSFTARPIVTLDIVFDSSNLVKDFTVQFKTTNGTIVFDHTNNSQEKVTLVDSDNAIADVEAITVIVHKVSLPNSSAIIIDMPVSSTILYKGYSDVSDLMSIDLLEELTYEDEIEALGGVSANEVTIVLDNSKRDFFFNRNTVVSRQLKKNRKIVPWLGAEVVHGQIEWHKLGTFWSYKWDVPVNSLTASVVAFDTIGLLDTTDYINHSTQVNKSLGELFEYVLEDAKKSLGFIEYYIDASLYDIIIPYAWFARGSHTAAIRKLSQCYPLHAYCDRNGVIQVRPQKLRLDFYYDEWSESTNVVDTSYSSLYTALPNIINVHLVTPAVLEEQQLVQDTIVLNVNGAYTKSFDFNKPYISDISVVVDCDNTVSYTYEVFSWGVTMYFTGTGTVRSVTCTGTCVDNSSSSTVTSRNDTSVRLNGAITRDIKSDFIQTMSLANELISRLNNLSEYDKYDASVQYRGDISLTINDPILLNDGIAPDNRYNIKRHELSWNGSLTGSADLNT